MPRKIQLAVAVAASVTATALTMSALAIAEGDSVPSKAPTGVGTARQIGPDEVRACLTNAGIAVPDGLSPIELKQFIGDKDDAHKALDACFPPPDKGDGAMVRKGAMVCKPVAGEPGKGALRARRTAAAIRAQAAASSVR